MHVTAIVNCVDYTSITLDLQGILCILHSDLVMVLTQVENTNY